MSVKERVRGVCEGESARCDGSPAIHTYFMGALQTKPFRFEHLSWNHLASSLT